MALIEVQEIHRATPDEYDDQATTSHDECWLIGESCWHDGSGLQFSEQIFPMIERIGGENVGQSWALKTWANTA